jgi:nicotinamidase-related amidase
MPVIFVQSIRDPHSPEFTVFGLKPSILRGTWGSQIAEELTPLPEEPIVEKNSHDCFNNTRMEQLLAAKGIVPCEWTIIVVGLGLTNCVGCAISGFSVRAYWVVVPMDCTASQNYEEEICQRFMQQGYSYNVALTRSDLLEIAVRPLAEVGTA